MSRLSELQGPLGAHRALGQLGAIIRRFRTSSRVQYPATSGRESASADFAQAVGRPESRSRACQNLTAVRRPVRDIAAGRLRGFRVPRRNNNGIFDTLAVLRRQLEGRGYSQVLPQDLSPIAARIGIHRARFALTVSKAIVDRRCAIAPKLAARFRAASPGKSARTGFDEWHRQEKRN